MAKTLSYESPCYRLREKEGLWKYGPCTAVSLYGLHPVHSIFSSVCSCKHINVGVYTVFAGCESVWFQNMHCIAHTLSVVLHIILNMHFKTDLTWYSDNNILQWNAVFSGLDFRKFTWIISLLSYTVYLVSLLIRILITAVMNISFRISLWNHNDNKTCLRPAWFTSDNQYHHHHLLDNCVSHVWGTGHGSDHIWTVSFSLSSVKWKK